MSLPKLSAFSPCGEYFVCNNDGGILTIWETASNNVKQKCSVNNELNTKCTSLIWGCFEDTIIEKINVQDRSQSLIFGTEKGSVHIYDYCKDKIYNHFRSGHADVVNDLKLHMDSGRLFSCSRDRFVIAWDVISGKKLMKLKADDEEIHSLCVIDDNNLLTGSTSIIWWNIEDQCVIKKFSSYKTPVILLDVVNSTEVSSSYFLSAVSEDSKISAWCLSKKNNKHAAASFLIPDELQNMDVNKNFSKNNPMLLTAVTKSGALVLFQHVLNGKTKSLSPEMTLRITSTAKNGDCIPSTIPIISSKILDYAESCIIAYGSTKNPVFESVNIFDCPKTMTLAREDPVQMNSKESNKKVSTKLNDCTVVNGQTSDLLSSYSSPKRKKYKETDSVNISSSQKQFTNVNSTQTSDRRTSKALSPNKKKKIKSTKKSHLSSDESEFQSEVCPEDPLEIVNCLLRGIEEENITLVNSVLQCHNSETIRIVVRNLPLHSLNVILLEFHRRLILQEKRYNSSLTKWVKEILDIHLPYLNTCKDHTDILNKMKDYIDKRKANETLIKLHMLRGLLKVQMQNLSVDEEESSSSDSDEELMES